MENLRKWLNNETDIFQPIWYTLLASLDYKEQVLFIRKWIEWHRLGKLHITLDNVRTMMSGEKSTIDSLEEIEERYQRYPKKRFKAHYKNGIDVSIYLVLQFIGTILKSKRIPYIMELYSSIVKTYKSHDDPDKFGELLAKLSDAELFNTCDYRIGTNVLTFRRKYPKHEGEAVKYDVLLTIYEDKKTVLKFFKQGHSAEHYKNIIFGEDVTVKKGYSGNDLIVPAELFEKVRDFLFSQAEQPIDEILDIAIRMKEQGGATTQEKYYHIRRERPYNVKFCEGKTPPSQHRLFEKPFKWCSGYACFNCDGLQRSTMGDYQNYTIYDFIEILMPRVDNKDHLLSWYCSANNFYGQITHMNCRKCNHMLEPLVWDRKTKSWTPCHFNARYVTHFWCNNDSCSEKERLVYINHCFVENCNNIIDSRDTKPCPNDFFICNKCGMCCSKSQFALKREAGLLSPYLALKYDKNEFHFDNNEFFCPKCGSLLVEKIESNIKYWECPNHSDYYGVFPRNFKNNEINKQLKILKETPHIVIEGLEL